MKPLRWMGSSLKDLQRMPESVRSGVGFALYMAQLGEKAETAKVLRGFGSADVLEIIEDFDGGTYRAVYTVRFSRAVFVLHCFQKRSRRGIATPKSDLDLIERRLRAAWLEAEREQP